MNTTTVTEITANLSAALVTAGNIAAWLTASDLRFIFKIGTQRIHGRGMNKAWKDGSQGVFTFKCPKCGKIHNPEEEFPGIVRIANVAPASRGSGRASRPTGDEGMEGQQKNSDALPPATGGASVPASRLNPKLTWAGDFRIDGSDHPIAAHDPLNIYHLACVSCGTELNRSEPIVEHRAPSLIAQRKWSFRISQLAIGAIDLSQIVARFQSAVADSEEMIVFRCDVLGLPQSTAQAITPAILDRARAVTAFDTRQSSTPWTPTSSPAANVPKPPTAHY